MTTNQTIDGVSRELVRENITYLRGLDGTYDQNSALAAKFELLLLDPAPLKDLREQYEAWADSNGYDITRNEHGDYAGIVEDSMWTGWQARGELRALLDAPAKPDLVECDACPTSGGCVSVCVKAPKPAAQPQGAGQVIDLDAVDWEAIRKAADESNWMPNEYMRNEWVADVCNFLKYGRTEQPAGVMPDPVKVLHRFEDDPISQAQAQGWNACLDEVARLNAEQPAPVAVAGNRTPFEIEHDAEPGDEAAFRQWRQERLNPSL